jgi:tRNA pseudouridine55 synthase
MDDRSGLGVGQQLNSAAELFGVLAINKPQGKTSRDVVNKIQQLIRPVKIGHTGTLDPLATGVLLLAVGKATRLVEYAHMLRKSYEADFLLGQSSPTLDIDGEVKVLPNAPVVDQASWLAQMEHWRGRIRQTPPQYSACQVNGRRAYDLARRGVEVELASREVTVYQLELLNYSYPLVSMSIQCSSGTYIRSLGHDIATALGSETVMSRLVRTAIGRFTLAECTALDQLNSCSDIQRLIRSPIGLVDQFPRFEVSSEECERLRTGSTVELTPQRAAAIETWRATLQNRDGQQPIPQPIVALDSQGQMVAILEVRQDRLQPTRVFL